MTKEYLSALFKIQLEKGFTTIRDLSEKTGKSYSRCFFILSQLEREGLVEKSSERLFVGGGGRGKLRGSASARYLLTEKGRRNLKVVLTGGTFDIIHEGHLATLAKAKSLGDLLVVVVARDKTVRRLKGRNPVNDEETRLYVVSNLKLVDTAILGDEEDPYKVVRQVDPDIIALGYDQKHREDEIRRRLEELGISARVIRLDVRVPQVKTSKLLSKLVKTL